MISPSRSPDLCSNPGKDYLPYILAKEGNHAVALVPRPSGGFVYALLRQRPSGVWASTGSSPRKSVILGALWQNECSHAGPLGWPDHPSFALNLHRFIASAVFPLDASALSADAAGAVPHGLEWC